MGFWEKIKSIFSRRKKCTCMASPYDGKYYCYKEVQGRLEACKGPFETLQECIQQSQENCNS